jgi:hypothetical protein
MPLARLVVTAVRVQGRSKSEVARDYQVSRRWVHELVKRFDAEGEAGLAPRSRRPWTSPQRTPQAPCEEIILLRKTLTDQGLDAGAHTIASDITHWRLAAGRHVEILNLVDDHSRLLVASHARPTTKAADVVASFHHAAAANGFPASMPSDNGAVFTAAPRGGGRCAIELELARWRSPTGTPAPTTRRPAARSNASTKPSNAGWASSPGPQPWPSCRPSSTSSPATTTMSGLIERRP